MAVRLQKGQKVNLRKENPNLKRVLVGLGWDPVECTEKQHSFFRRFLGITSETPAKAEIDVDGSIFSINRKNHHKKTVFFNNLEAYDGAIRHYGDNRTGEGKDGGDDEQIEIKLDCIPEKIQKLSIIINIYQAYERHQTFEQIRNCFVHVTDMDSGKELVRYDIDGNFTGMTGIFVADLERSGNDWHFKAIGEGVRVRNITEMIKMKCD